MKIHRMWSLSMILPTKHISTRRALIGTGATVLKLLDEPKTVSTLWNTFRSNWSVESSTAPISYQWFIHTLEFLYIIGVIDFVNGTLVRTKL